MIPSFQIVEARGVTGSVPWSALALAPMWSEPVGLSREKTAVLIALFGIASSFGGLFGGKMGGFVTARHPNFGRTVLAHISSASASSSI
ncbi:hypothetical protein NC652_014102 [Populus alba x Populus x berolinensis]|nr:hypothetical protein NC652_014102 [Populus alba x Populus x berolinensis]